MSLLAAQAAAQREHVQHHPVLQAPCVRAYLAQRHRTRANIASATCTRQLLPGVPDATSPDLTLYTTLGPESTVLVRDLVSHCLARSWSLPQVPAAICPAVSWAWASDSAHLTLLFGSAWGWDDDAGPDDTASGLIFVDLLTGSCLVVSLPQPQQVVADLHPCPSRNIVLISHGNLQAQTVLSLYNQAGALLSTHPAPGGASASRLHITWAPSGQAAAVLARDTHSFWLWPDFSTSHFVLMDDGGPGALFQAWASPASSSIALYNTAASVIFSDLQGRHTYAALPLEEATGEIVFSEWGCRLAFLVRTSQAAPVHAQGCDQLQLYSRSLGGPLVLEHMLTAWPRLFADQDMQLSADGELLAAVTMHPSRDDDRQLAVIFLATGTMKQLPLPDSAALALDECMYVCWSADDSAVLVSAPHRACAWLVSFQ